jgi:hypothetical protein
MTTSCIVAFGLALASWPSMQPSLTMVDGAPLP